MRVQSAEFSKVKSFQDLIAWQKAMGLTKLVYYKTARFPKNEDYCLTSQIRRAAVSVSSNIAEGSSRKSTQEFIRFLNIAYGSLSEIESQTLTAKMLSYITDEDSNDVFLLTSELGKIINGLIKSLSLKTEI